MVNPAMFGRMADEIRREQRQDAIRSAAHEKRSRQGARAVEDLEDRLERLSLVCMAMWSLLQDKTNLTEEDLLQRVQMLDLMDGTADGKATRTVQKCHKCGRTMSPKHRKCLYCGASETHESAFDAI